MKTITMNSPPGLKNLVAYVIPFINSEISLLTNILNA